ncbi:hypothetical protein OVA10_11445 [Lelliottia sp. SL45]|uniref:hypothetical protein n=1 Tax=Lelliottia sp. SL45 TaxID=2994665 RepID=UPI002275489E|nr:hypothetical protein [Lelliottia sp. SL45]MCY1698659.1 hypothetical protein [Lelliottia sp. SL45]
MARVAVFDLHNAVLTHLKGVSWQRDVGAYPELKTALVTPALYFAINAWSRADAGTDQLHVDTDCSVYLAVNRSLEIAGNMSAELYARDLADELTCLVDAQTFGLNIEPSVFVSAEVDEFDTEMDDYHLWRIDFSVQLPVGVDPHDIARAPLKQVWLGKAPDIGCEHEEDYLALLPEVRRE